MYILLQLIFISKIVVSMKRLIIYGPKGYNLLLLLIDDREMDACLTALKGCPHLFFRDGEGAEFP